MTLAANTNLSSVATESCQASTARSQMLSPHWGIGERNTIINMKVCHLILTIFLNKLTEMENASRIYSVNNPKD